MNIRCLFGKHEFTKQFFPNGKAVNDFIDEDCNMINCKNCGYTFQIEEKDGKKTYTKLKWLGT